MEKRGEYFVDQGLQVADGERFEDCTFDGCNLHADKGVQASFKGCTFKDCSFTGYWPEGVPKEWRK